MSGISSSVGPFSGIDSGSLINQLLAIESRPKILAQQRMAQLQLQQSSFLDINSKLSALKTAAALFRQEKTFQTTAAASSDEKVLTAIASVGAGQGSYSFLVDRLVTSQQMLSQGFGDKDSVAMGATSFTFESALARLDRDTSLADLNGGAGVERGKILVTDSTGKSATVDLSKAITVADVLDAINSNGTAAVTASVNDGKFVIKDAAGGNVTIANGLGSTTAASLGIAGTAAGTLTGSQVYFMASGTALSILNDGNGVYADNQVGSAAFDFKIKVDTGSGPTLVKVNIGDKYDSSEKKVEGAVSTVGGVLTRINDALQAAGFTTVRASISADGTRLKIADSASATTSITVEENSESTARDLGLLGSTATGTLNGSRVLAGLTSTLTRGINGGSGVTGDGVLNFTARDGFTGTLTISTDSTLEQIAAAISAASGTVSGRARLEVAINSKGTGLVITDTTGGTSNLTITGTGGSDTAASLGISTGATGVAASSVTGANLQRQYVGRTTLLSSLNNGKGIGTGRIRITDSAGVVQNIDVSDNQKTVGDLIDLLNSRGLGITARINAGGDGVEIIESLAGGATGASKIKIEDVNGGVAKALNLAGEAAGTGVQNKINGSYERTVTFAATDTLQQVADKINAARPGVAVSIIRDGSGSTPFRLNFVSEATGRSGRFLLDSGGLDLGMRTLDAGEDARVFFGSSDPARAIALTRSSNTLDGVIQGVKIDLKSVSAEPVTLTVSKDTSAIEGKVNSFISAFNDVIGRVDFQTRYDDTTKRSGPLIGDSTALQLRNELYRVIQGKAIGASGTYSRLTDIGLKIGSGGKLELDTAKFRAAMEQDPASVEALFAARTSTTSTTKDLGGGITASDPTGKETFTALGVVGQIEELGKKYLDSVDGVLTRRGKTLDNQISSQNKRIEAMDARLEVRRQVLQRQFIAMEQAIGQLQSQQSALSGISRVG
ncbi:MAG: flagellar filament capping protein FliD [Phycisphaerales bacterium]|nr:flagellar filament capping protein FliD [Phycisphaerales bacterium]